MRCGATESVSAVTAGFPVEFGLGRRFSLSRRFSVFAEASIAAGCLFGAFLLGAGLVLAFGLSRNPFLAAALAALPWPVLVLALGGPLVTRGPVQVLAVTLGGGMIRSALTLGLLLAAWFGAPDCRTVELWLWGVGFYLIALSIETAALVRLSRPAAK